MNIKKSLGYKDVWLIPQRCKVQSRTDCSTTAELGGHRFDMPIYPSNMKSVVSASTCLYLAKKKWFYTMHRFNADPCLFYEFMKSENQIVSLSMGVNQESYTQLSNLKKKKYKPEFITVDIANAWSDKAENMVKTIRNLFPDTFLIAGNVATADACLALESWGANAVKVGISCGKVCITRNKTGFNYPMISCIDECASSKLKIPIIADGGITEHGDMAKAFAVGAHMVMAGSLFAGYQESAGNILEIDGVEYKEYFGSASEHNKGEYKNVEGKKILTRFKGSMDKLLVELKEDLQSSISYAGGYRLADLYQCPLTQYTYEC